MDNRLQIFNFHDSQVRTLADSNGEPWFVAKDVCDILSLDHTALRKIDDDEKGGENIPTLGGAQRMTIVSEPGLYKLVMRSNKPEAKEFQRWVTHEVLPSIRKHGMYATDQTVDRILADPDFGIKMLTALKEERSKRQQAEQTIEQQKPKVLFADAVNASRNSILVGDLAKMLRANGVNIGANRLFAQLREDGYLISRKGSDWNMPTQRSMELGLFEIKETAITHSDGHITTNRTPKVTGKGQQYFINRYLKQ